MKKNLENFKKINKIVEAEYGTYLYDCELDTYPNECPKCHHAILPEELSSIIFRDENYKIFKLSLTYLCPSCFDSFICQYLLVNGIKKGQLNLAIFEYIAPKDVANEIFSDIIQNISPEFIDFYNQSLNAEHLGFKDIAGPGYRKSVEFLVKDFAIKNYPDDKEAIEKSPLAQCINKYIDNETIKDTVKAATWLGNDQTHYKQKHTDKNLEDLKLFIRLAISWIELDENTKILRQFITK
ncbi:DUF4145 domain-containing protein [Bacillus cereus]|uniref:DUF4145 domain-containing protein n=1 Tax=Bacillus cereus TaxID=1396 RepID=UPI000B4B6A8A|nr:DUF4145 domain-containing protein [Bacillus cereus]